MAAGTRTYRQADTGNFNKFITDKIRSARDTAAEARKANESGDVKTEKGYFFGKSLAREFGGDKLARVRGTFSKNPSASDDPALTKEQRFNADVQSDFDSAGVTVQKPLPGLEDLGDTVVTQDKEVKSWLTPLLDSIARNNQKISDGIKNLGKSQGDSAAQQKESNKELGILGNLVELIKGSYIDEVDLGKKEVSLMQQELDLAQDAADDAKQAKSAEILGQVKDTAGTDPRGEAQNKRGGGLFGGLFDKLKDGILDGLGDSIDRRGGSRDSKKSRGPKGPKGPKGPNPKGPKGPKGPTGPRGPNIPRGGGFKGRGFGGAVRTIGGGLLGGGFQRFSEGTSPVIDSGLKTSPETGVLPSNKGVVPLNRNNSFSDLFDGVKNSTKGKEKKEDTAPSESAKLLQKAVLLPLKLSGAFIMSGAKTIINNMGGGFLSSFLTPVINNFSKSVGKFFGIDIMGTSGSGEAGQPGQDGADGETTTATAGGRRIGGKKGGGLLSKIGKGIKGAIGGAATALGFSNPFGSSGSGGDTYQGPTIPETQYNVSGGNKITQNMFGSRGFQAKDGLGSGGTAFGHTGRDVSLPSGTPLTVTAPGTVIESSTGDNGGYGNFVAIKLDDGRVVKSNHHKRNLVKEGDRVGMGADGSAPAIAEVGSTGLSTGPHLHLDVGTGPYNRASASVGGLMNPDAFILGGGIVTGGDVTASVAGQPQQASLPSGAPMAPSMGPVGAPGALQAPALTPQSQPMQGPPDPNAQTAATFKMFAANIGKQQKPPQQKEYLNPLRGNGLLQNPTSTYLYTGRVGF